MKQISNLFVASLALFLFIAEPALAQSIDGTLRWPFANPLRLQIPHGSAQMLMFGLRPVKRLHSANRYR